VVAPPRLDGQVISRWMEHAGCSNYQYLFRVSYQSILLLQVFRSLDLSLHIHIF
jgi:hypothetical protein